MGALSWLTGVGIPSLVGFVTLAGAAWAWFQIPAFGKYIGLALACVGVAILANAKGFSDARALCNEGAVRAELEQRLAIANADLEAHKRAAGSADTIAKQLLEAERRNQELIDARRNAANADDCRVSPDAARRVLGIK